MSLSYEELAALCQEMRSNLIGMKFQDCFFSTPRTWILKFESLSKSQSLLMCFQPPFCRFHLMTNPAEKLKDPFSKWLVESLQGFEIVECQLLNDDRILEIVFKNKGNSLKLIGEFFSKSPNFYLIDSDHTILHAIFPINNNKYVLPIHTKKTFSPISTQHFITHQQVERDYSIKEYKHQVEQEKSALDRTLKKQINRVAKRYTAAIEQLKACQGWATIMHEATLLQSNMYRLTKGMNTILVSDWQEEGKEISLSLDSLLMPHEEIAKRFKQAKKLKLGLEHVERRLKEIKEEEAKMIVLHDHLTSLNTLKDLHRFSLKYPNLFKQNSQITKKQSVKEKFPFRQFYTETGLSIWVGKTAKDNEALTFQFAHGEDYWLHVSDFPGSHVLLRPQRNTEPDQDSIKDAIQIALYYSKAKEKGEGEVCLTQRKFVKRYGKGKVGKVVISKHKSLFSRLDLSRIRQIQKRKIPYSSSLKR